MSETMQTLRVRGLRWESDGVVSVELEDRASGVPLPAWTPGAHVDVRLPNGLVRQYSLCGEPGASSWRIAVLHEPGRGGSTYVHETLRPGQLLDVVGPRNHFELAPATAYVFVAGGIGITPILPMVGECVAAGRPWRLVYGGRTRSAMAFVDELAAYGGGVELVPEDEVGPIDVPGALAGLPAGAAAYCCGPAGLLDAVTAAAREAGVECRTERFTPVMSAREARAGGEFDVVLKRSGRSLTVRDGESIMEVVERAGIVPPSSCREGTCASCETGVISGAVDHRDGILTEEERRESLTMMICVSRSLGPELVLDL
ncbi:PDR/VanB family oxidoreductase [Nocardioides hungaricus]